MKKDAHKSSLFLPTGSTVAAQRENSRPWSHDTEVEHGLEDHNGRSYKIWVTRM